MKKILQIVLALSFCQLSIAQLFIPLEDIADDNIGWMKVVKYTQPTKPLNLAGRNYSAKQIRYCEQFIEWMQQSYVPKGCLGDVRVYVNTNPGASYSDKLKKGLPHLYGSYSKLYMFLKKDAKGKLVPQTGLADYWRIEANQLEYISNPVQFISTPDQYYFTMPYFHNNVKRDWSSYEQKANWLGFDKNSNLENYMHFYQPKNAGAGLQYVVIMTKDNKLPFETITVGEFFTKAEEQLPIWQKNENRSAELLATARKNLNRLKEKYKNQWNDVAEFRSSENITFYSFVNANEDMRDMFEKDAQTTGWPIYKISAATMAACKTDQPQWLTIRWDAGIQDKSYAAFKHESIMNNFNFDYLYNYFFYPDKVKGQSYKPLNSPLIKEAIVITEASLALKKATADKKVFFFDDFSTTATGKLPINWSSTVNQDGKKAVVTEASGDNIKWLELKGNAVSITNLKNTIPKDFEISFDIAVPQNFTWGAKRLSVELANANTKFALELKPGFNGKVGFASFANNISGADRVNSNGYEVFGFSNNKVFNKVNTLLRKNGDDVSLFINGILVARYLKAIVNDIQFKSLKFIHIGSDGETEKYFISNVKITSFQ